MQFLLRAMCDIQQPTSLIASHAITPVKQPEAMFNTRRVFGVLVQVKVIREKFEAALGKDGARMVDINTIDGFQV